MLIIKEVITKWNPANKKYYEDLGYTYTKHNADLKVPIEHLHKGSNIYVEFICDVCEEKSTRRFNRYVSLNNKYQKDICRKCITGIISQETRQKQDDSYGEYNTIEKRKVALIKYLEEYKTLAKMNVSKNGKKLYMSFSKNNENVYDIAEELGYDIITISGHLPKNYWEKHNKKVLERIQEFINKHNRFPLLKEIENELKIETHYITKSGGINHFKKLLNYNDKNDLRDLRGDYNKSNGELILSNYFYSQGLKDYYNREEHPFPKPHNNYRSDFSFLLEDNTKLHIEVWGIKENENGIWSKQYKKTRKIKEDLYKRYNIKYVGVNYETFDKTYDEIQQHLYNLLNPYLKLKFKKVEYNKLLSASLLTDDEIFNGIISFSKDNYTFPTSKELSKYNSALYTQILKRGYTYLQFAQKYNCTLKTINYEWNEELIYSLFDEMVEQKILINKSNLNKFNSALSDAVSGNIFNLKINYFTKKDIVPKHELKWLIDLANNRTKTTANYDSEDVKLAKELLDKHYPNYNCEEICHICKIKINTNHIYDIYCNDCLNDIQNNNIKYSKTRTPYSEKDYEENFHKCIELPNALTMKGFNDISTIKVQAYRNYFGLIWVDILKKYDKYEDLLNYIVNEYLTFYNGNTKNSFITFAQQHQYISMRLIQSLNQDDLHRVLNSKQS